MKAIFGPMRPSFLILTPACVALGFATAYQSGAEISLIQGALALVGAVAAHVAVNALNEYFDFRSGLDTRTRRTPFSGGSGTLPEHPELAPLALVTGIVSAALTAVVGLFFVAAQGFALLPLGLLGLFLVLLYTPWLTQRPWLCLVAPGLGFGPCMVLGTQVALTGQYSWAALITSMVPFFLVNNLLLLNQFPDLEADRSVGRKTLPILIGRRRSSYVYSLFFGLSMLALGAAVYLRYLPPFSLIGFAGLAAGVPVFRGLARCAEDTEDLLPRLGLNVVASVATPALAALGAFIG